MKFIVEHLEKRLGNWCFLEYRHISRLVGKKNLVFTNTNSKKLKGLGRVYSASVSGLGLKNCCVLDPAAKKTLTPKEARKFCCFVFGGILGDFPARKRTKRLKLAGARRNLGKGQFATDNAVYVAKKILSGTPVSKLKFRDNVVIKTKKGEEIILPFRYVLIRNKPLVSRELVAMLRRQKGF